MYNPDMTSLRFNIFVIFIILLLTSVYLIGNSREIIRLKDRKTTSLKDMVEEVRSAGVIFIGEQHDDPAHHKTQLDVIKTLHEKDSNLSIGLEMFKKEDQENLDGWISGRIPEKKFIPHFLKNWGFGWELYRDIFLFARTNKIPLLGLNVPDEITRKVGKTGFLSLTDEERMKLPPGVTCELDQEYMDHLVMVFQYKKNTDKSFFYFCEAQVLWDQAMAWHLTDYMKKNPERTVIVLAGAIHTWKYGIPKQKQRYISGEQKVIVPDLPVGPDLISEDDADYLVIHG
jgi:uncharacterized iron-regulated protein